MQLIDCPWCGAREEVEFHYGGQAHVPYPVDPAALTDEQWARYIFFRDNPKGRFHERWSHSHGCRRWFTISRDTASDEILSGPTPIGWPKPPRGSAADPGGEPPNEASS